VLVFCNVESTVVIPAEFDGEIEAVQAMVDGAFVSTWAHDGVSVRSEFLMIRFKGSPCFFGTSFENDNHETPHEESSICLLSVVKRGIMIYLVIGILFIADQFF